MTNTELALNMLAEAATTELSKEKNPQHLEEHEVIAKQGGKAAEAARKQLESDLGHSVISPLNARTGLRLIKTTKNRQKAPIKKPTGAYSFSAFLPHGNTDGEL